MKEQKNDVLEIRLVWNKYEQWDEGSDENPVYKMVLATSYYINGISLLDMIREVEAPYCEAEECPELTASYALNSKEVMRRQFNRALDSNSFFYEEGIGLFCCEACFMICCWSVFCKIREEGDFILMTDFYHNHRDWTYPFVFRFTKEIFFAELKKLEVSTQDAGGNADEREYLQ